MRPVVTRCGMRSSIRLIITSEAELDVEEIAQYTLEHWGDERVDAYRARLMRSFRQLQTFPEIGRVADNDDPTIREFALEHHTILYRHDADANLVTILRIVNPRRLRR